MEAKAVEMLLPQAVALEVGGLVAAVAEVVMAQPRAVLLVILRLHPQAKVIPEGMVALPLQTMEVAVVEVLVALGLMALVLLEVLVALERQ